MKLYTSRLILRPWTESDISALFALAKDPDIGVWAGWKPHKTESDSLAFLHSHLMHAEIYAVCLKSGEIIGSVGLTPWGQGFLPRSCQEAELGFWLGKAYQGQGYMREACAVLLRRAFCDLRLSAIRCGCYWNNVPSLRLQRRLGFGWFWPLSLHQRKQMGIGRPGWESVLSKRKWKRTLPS
jgi:RimJ/RimL family protein N-acetyltransferase